ncbi:MAG: hypothetical protein ACKVS8_09330 [Phycisphaerales bacterium]
MARCRVDKSIERLVVDGFTFPLGVYPVEQMTPRPGYTVSFESADGGGDERDGPPHPGEDWEEWPDRYVWDICITAPRVEALFRALVALMPGRVFPILDVLGQDAYREIDPFVAYELVGLERFLDAIRQYRGYFFEDGLVGFGAMSEDPFFYVFVDEHKVLTVRAATDLKDRVEKVLAAFDLEPLEHIAAADAALHEHRSVLEAPSDRPDLLTPDEIVEDLRDLWGLSLNIDPDTNVDEDGSSLSIVGWRVVVRAVLPGEVIRYVEVLLTAENLATAHELAVDAAQHLVEAALDEDPPKGARSTGTGGPARLPGPDTPPSAATPGSEGELVPADANDPSEEDDDENLAEIEPSVEIDVLGADRIRPDDFPKALAEFGAGGTPADFSLNRVCSAVWVE